MPFIHAWIVAYFCLVLGFFESYGQETPNSYAPSVGPCSSSPSTRFSGTVSQGNQALGSDEAAYIRKRRTEIIPNAYKKYLKNVESSLRVKRREFPSYVAKILSGSSENLPRVSAAISGGGLRATFMGAGILNALDDRNFSSAAAGTGGLLQALDYITGLSGGACLVMGIAQANFPTMYEAALGSENREAQNEKTNVPLGVTNGWLAYKNFVVPTGFSPAGGVPIGDDAAWWTAIVTQVLQKFRAGFEITVGDIYARILGYHFVNGTTEENFFDPRAPHGQGETLSGLYRNVQTIRSASQPFPIITSVPQSKNQDDSKRIAGAVVPVTNNQYEFNIFESGSWDPNLATFVKTSDLGTNLTGGKPIDSKRCVYNFDNLGFLIATSSNIFRKYDTFLTLFIPQAYQPILPALNTVLSRIPNPFKGLGTDQYLDRDESSLGLMDGSFGGENIPFAPLLVPARKVDVIVAADFSGDVLDYADGTSLINTAKRSSLMPSKSYPFPKVPQKASNINTSHPTFFGCDEPVGIPLVIYIPNSPPSVGINLPTISLEVTKAQSVAAIDGGTKLATRGISGDNLWSACLACAVVERSRERLGDKREGICRECFERYCYKSQ